MACHTVLFGILIATVSWLASAQNLECIETCRSQYPFPWDRPAPCCGCCGMNQSCQETIPFTTCCDSNQLFCGCLSSRASCFGRLFNESAPNTFGMCYDPLDPMTSSCCYNPMIESWILCPANTQCCGSATNFSCCAADEVCSSTITSPSPQCVKVCSIGQLNCGALCYDSSEQCCVNDVLYPIERCPRNPSTIAAQPEFILQSTAMSTSPEIPTGGITESMTSTGTSTGSMSTTSTIPEIPTGGITESMTTGSVSTTGRFDACANVQCGGTESCCDGYCYSPTLFTCFFNEITEKRQLCPVGHRLCGSDCYRPSQYYCQYNGYYYLEPITSEPEVCRNITCQVPDQQCCALNETAGECLDSFEQTCCTDPYLPDFSVICGKNEEGVALSCCGPIFESMDGYRRSVKCYDATVQKCCHRCSPGGCVALICTPGDPFCC